MSEYVVFSDRRISGIVFDKDGTLFDFRATWTAWARSFLADLADGCEERAHALGQAIGFDSRTGEYHPQSPVIAGTPVEIAEHLLPHLHHQDFAALLGQMNEAAVLAPMVEAAPLIPLLDHLSGLGLKLGVATNDAEASARSHLAAVGVVDRFDFIAGSDSGHGAKPMPGQLLAFAREISCPADQVIMVGDSRHDLSAGRAAGMVTIGVLTGPAWRSDLDDLADHVLDHVGQLQDRLQQRGG